MTVKSLIQKASKKRSKSIRRSNLSFTTLSKRRSIMELLNFLNELDGDKEASADPAPEPGHAGKGKKSRSRRPGSGASAESAEPSGRAEGEKTAVRVDADPTAAASWAFRKAYPEGALDEGAAAHVRAARASLKPVAAAFKRHGASIMRSEDAMRRALAWSYGLAEALRDQPATVNALLEEKRIKATKPVRDNIFLATLKLVCPEAPPDTANRWASALAYAAANGCVADDLPAFLRKTGIREAADRWGEMRRAAKPVAEKPPRAESDVEILRGNSLGISLPHDFATPSRGLFLLIAESREGGAVGHALVTDKFLVARAVRHSAKATAPRSGGAPDAHSND
jgi:hypothetical protein